MKMATEIFVPQITDICDEGNICVEGLNVFYGDRQALKDINITLPAKKITAIIGPSGCGKTTLLKCFNRLIDSIDGTKVTGKVMLNGEDIFDPHADVIKIRKKMGLLSQRPYPLPMSIFDNVAYGPRIHGIRKKSELNQIVEYYLKEASLWDEVKDRLNTPASGLSIGQQQRLCLARGLAVKPEIILGDEPTSALDPISSAHIEQKFVEFKNKYTIVMVTHILRQAIRIADYIIFMYLGEIIEHGPAYQVLENPKDKRTSDYIKGIIS
ncbi:phosphate ABC transporter ATP-binding protein [Sporocytophaga myxococcoides]|uniref:Phosphate ABC transporter ATP-binding protein n=1 Tax=Sporocytophaga myxococcoides TaxID=153721 RepID=A0A098LAD0_9BACT|nr:phosphate ABC transporter ATP-binding protein PstB [Sporocytophaga myxococcoides]GAL83374.1 phosphate ABC transporter ATP-binding protein [Sporocytophaga myxococcoides]